MQDKRVALVTKANKGFGLQIAKDLTARGFTVLVGSRNVEHGETAAKSVGADARAVQLDVTGSIVAAAEVQERVRPPRRARQQRGYLACGTAGQVARRDREVRPPERRQSRRGSYGV